MGSFLTFGLRKAGKAEICERFPDISVQTAENVLGRLLKEEKIVKIRNYRNARYKKK